MSSVVPASLSLEYILMETAAWDKEYVPRGFLGNIFENAEFRKCNLVLRAIFYFSTIGWRSEENALETRLLDDRK